MSSVSSAAPRSGTVPNAKGFDALLAIAIIAVPKACASPVIVTGITPVATSAARKGRRGAEVGRHHRRAGERAAAGDGRRGAFDRDVGAHALGQVGDLVHERDFGGQKTGSI